MFTSFQISILILLTVSLAVSYNVLANGRCGWGWKAISLLIATGILFGKGLISLFVEITSEHCPPDWDEE